MEGLGKQLQANQIPSICHLEGSYTLQIYRGWEKLLNFVYEKTKRCGGLPIHSIKCPCNNAGICKTKCYFVNRFLFASNTTMNKVFNSI